MGQIARAAVVLPRPAATRLRAEPLSRGFYVLLASMLVAGLALRLVAARGELWVDEIWSLNLVAPLHSAGEVFWGISHDNNHFLNSLWLYEAGPNRATILYRLPAVLLGTLSILVAAWIGLRRDAPTAIATGLLASSSFVLVNYGSEARGYAGLVPAILLAIDAFEQAVASRQAGGSPGARLGSNASRWALAAAIGLGTLCHLTMLSTAAVLGIVAVARFGRTAGSLRDVTEDVAWLFWPSWLLLVPAGAALTAGILVRDGFTMGGAEPFSVTHFLAGYGDLLRFTLGLPRVVPPWAVLGLVAVAVLLAGRLDLIAEERRPVLAAALVVLPGIMLAATLPNLEYPRYFLTSGVVLLLCLGDAFGRLWHRAGAWRWGGAALLVCILGGQVSRLDVLLVHGRGAYGEALSHMAQAGDTSYASNAPFATRTVMDHLAAGVAATPVEVPHRNCPDLKPGWFVGSATGEADPPASVVLGPPACRATYGIDVSYPSSALSGLRWTLYRLQIKAAAPASD